MRIRSSFSLAVAVILFSITWLQASPIPLPPAAELARATRLANGEAYAFMLVDDNWVDLSSSIVKSRDNDLSYLAADVTAHGVHALVNATIDPDPFISFGATTTNLVPGATTFAFLFGTPIVPGMYTDATSTGGVSLTNGASGTTTVDNSTTTYPTYISGYGTVGLTATNLNVDNGTGAVVASGPPFTVTTTRALPTVSNSFVPTFYDNLEALLTYTQDDVSSTASWTGAVTLNVPEPALAGLLGLCIVLLHPRRVR